MMHLTKTYNLTHATLKPDPINKNHRENTHVTTTDKPTDRKAGENNYEDLKHKKLPTHSRTEMQRVENKRQTQDMKITAKCES